MLTAFALGLAGLDPAGALLVAGALAAGAREGHVALFGLVVLVGTVVLGTTLSLTVGPRIAEIDWSVFAPGDRTVAFVETLLGVGLVCWGVVRARRPTAHAPKPRSARGTGPSALVGAGILFALSAVFDPTFVALTVIAGRDGTFWSAGIAQSVWVLVSQAPPRPDPRRDGRRQAQGGRGLVSVLMEQATTRDRPPGHGHRAPRRGVLPA